MSEKDIKGYHSINMLENVTMLDIAKMSLIHSTKIEFNSNQLNSFNKNELLELLNILIEKDNKKSLRIKELENEVDYLQDELLS